MATNRSIVHFSGHVGNLIGYYVRGHRYLRSMPSSVRNPRTPSQQSHRQRFALVSSFVAAFRQAYSLGYRNYKTDNFPRANFFNQVYNNAVLPDLSIDPSRILISRGPLSPYVPNSTTLSRNHLILSWKASHANPEHRLTVCIYNHSRHVALTRPDCARRGSSLNLVISLPPEWISDHLYIYTFFRDTNSSSASDSTLVAQFNAPDSDESKTAELQLHIQHLTHNWTQRYTSATYAASSSNSPPGT